MAKRALEYSEEYAKRFKTASWRADRFADRSKSFSELSESIEAVKEKLSDAEYLRLYNAALGVHRTTVDVADGAAEEADE